MKILNGDLDKTVKVRTVLAVLEKCWTYQEEEVYANPEGFGGHYDEEVVEIGVENLVSYMLRREGGQ